MSTTNYLVPLIREYLENYNIHHDIDILQIALQSAPSFPSLMSIQQTCVYFGLKTKAYKGDYDALLENTLPAIVHWKTENEEKFILVSKVTSESVTYYDATKHLTSKISKDDFCKFWTGVLIISEKNGGQKVSGSKTAIRKYWVYGLALLTILIVFLFGFQNSLDTTSLYFALGLFLLKATGVWLTANIIQHEFGFVYSPFESFCNKLESFDCNKVLNSKASKLINMLSLADIGLVYFSTGAFAIMISVLSGLQNEILPLLFYVAVGGIPFVLFSILYQKYIVKKWCPLCLGVVGLVVLENLVFLLYLEIVIPNTFFLFAGNMLIISLIFSILIVHFFKNLIKAQGDSLISKLQNLQLKRNPAVLISLFNRQKKTEIPQKHSINIGNQMSPVVITTLLSPMCKPCKKMTSEIIKLLEKHPESFLWQIRFDGIEKEAYHPVNAIQLHIKQLCDNEKEGNSKLKIVKDWFSWQSLQRFYAQYPINEIAPETITSFAEQINENNKLDVNRVPVLWINNRMLPQEYSVADIPLLCTDVNLLLQLTK